MTTSLNRPRRRILTTVIAFGGPGPIAPLASNHEPFAKAAFSRAQRTPRGAGAWLVGPRAVSQLE